MKLEITLLASVAAAAVLAAACHESVNSENTGPLVYSASPVSCTWPNKPANLADISDFGMDEPLPTSGQEPLGTSGWSVVRNSEPESNVTPGWAVLETASGPCSPGVYDFVYPQADTEGDAPATVYTAFSGRETYVGFEWMASDPFDVGPNGNKIAFLFNAGAGGQMFMILGHTGRDGERLLSVLPEYPSDFVWRDPNVNSTSVTLNTWHLIEWYVNLDTHVLKWWLDGTLQGDYTDINQQYDFSEFQFSPTWGGNSGATKLQRDHYWFDHVHISGQ